eukprot:2680676-Pyramimonas_sp.AAC.1
MEGKWRGESEGVGRIWRMMRRGRRDEGLGEPQAAPYVAPSVFPPWLFTAIRNRLYYRLRPRSPTTRLPAHPEASESASAAVCQSVRQSASQSVSHTACQSVSQSVSHLSLIHISEPTRPEPI